MIVGGLLFEVIILLAYSAEKPWHETALLIISALVIAVGVWGEDHFAHEADAANVELQRLSDERVAAAEARAAEATARAEHARLELARLTTPRVISPEQRVRLIEAVTPFAATPFDILVQPEPEPMALMDVIGDALVEAGWQWLNSRQTLVFSRSDRPSVGMITGTGVRLQIAQSKIVDWERPILALRDGLIAAGLEDVEAQQVEDASVNVDAMHIRVRRKS
jgi:hypothetical protein